MAAAALIAACGPIAGVVEKPCRPGCVDDHTRLECENGVARAVSCPATREPCATSVCQEGACGFRPAVGAPCGPDGLATCNEGYACLGPRLKLTAFRRHTCALDDDGRVWCWGDNPYGELGDGSNENSGFPIPVRLPRAAVDVSAGYRNTCAVLDDGSAYCWGNSSAGQGSPDSQDFNSSAPTLVSVPGVNFIAVSCAEDHTCAITTESKVYCWGSTAEGQCGVDGGKLGIEQVGPTEVPQLDNVKSIESGLSHTCAVRTANPSLVCWGSNMSRFGDRYLDGKLGPAADGMNYSAKPLPIELGDPMDPNSSRNTKIVLDVGAGYESTFAVATDGKTYAWGANARGQLGSRDQTELVEKPSVVFMYDDAKLPGPVPSVADVLRANASGQCAKMQDLLFHSRYLCWGGDDHGELGFGMSGQDKPYATATAVLSQSATNLVLGEDHSCVSDDDQGRVEISCYGLSGLVANGTTDHLKNQLVPIPIKWNPQNFERMLSE